MAGTVVNFSFLELLEELVVGLVDLFVLGDENLLHHLLDHVILLTDVCVLGLYLGFKLLISDLHLVYLLLQFYFLLVEPLFICVLHALRHVGPLVLVLLGFLVCEVCNALQIFGGLQLVPGCRLGTSSSPLAKRSRGLHERGLLHHASISIA